MMRVERKEIFYSLKIGGFAGLCFGMISVLALWSIWQLQMLRISLLPDEPGATYHLLPFPGELWLLPIVLTISFALANALTLQVVNEKVKLPGRWVIVSIVAEIIFLFITFGYDLWLSLKSPLGWTHWRFGTSADPSKWLVISVFFLSCSVLFGAVARLLRKPDAI